MKKLISLFMFLFPLLIFAQSNDIIIEILEPKPKISIGKKGELGVRVSINRKIDFMYVDIIPNGISCIEEKRTLLTYSKENNNLYIYEAIIEMNNITYDCNVTPSSFFLQVGSDDLGWFGKRKIFLNDLWGSNSLTLIPVFGSTLKHPYSFLLNVPSLIFDFFSIWYLWGKPDDPLGKNLWISFIGSVLIRIIEFTILDSKNNNTMRNNSFWNYSNNVTKSYSFQFHNNFSSTVLNSTIYSFQLKL